MFTIAIKSRRVIVFLSIGTQFSKSAQKTCRRPLERRKRSRSGEAEREKVQREGPGEEGLGGLIPSTHWRTALRNEV